ncbi:MAG TPA: hypothetical protein VMF03_11135 [Steroidobacteraceae bacterium]|nr:hypothetical protein [Steroidobacteraceae bacterium]
MLAAYTASLAAGVPAPGAYAQMAPLDQYLMADRDAEIALARSAAPASVSADATVLVLNRRGYETAVQGDDGFTCLVERAWMDPFDNPEFWNPKQRGPVCYNAAASRSVLPYTLFRTRLVLMGVSKAQLLERIKAAVARKELVTPEIGAMSYMMSKRGYLSDEAGPWHSHLMFHLPKTQGASWGADLPGTPVIVDTDHTEVPEPQTIFMVPLATWSDGSPATPHH